jgi:hypothetical protein
MKNEKPNSERAFFLAGIAAGALLLVPSVAIAQPNTMTSPSPKASMKAHQSGKTSKMSGSPMPAHSGAPAMGSPSANTKQVPNPGRTGSNVGPG